MRRRPTITDVARLSGVSAATVSRVLNGKSSFSASQGVRDKINSVATQLGYVPDLSARNLNRRQTHLIGLFGSPYMQVGEGITENLLEGVAEVMQADGYDMFLEMAALNRAAPTWRFDGAVLLQAARPELVTELDKRSVPYVCVNDRIGQAAAYVLANDVMGTTLAVDHLHTLGHKRIAYANARTTYYWHHYSVAERYETLRGVAQMRQMQVVSGPEEAFADATKFLQAMTKKRATAVLCYDHRIAVEIFGAATNMGLRVPADFSLICFNDVFPVATLSPSFTCVAVDGRDMGHIGANLLLDHLRQPQLGPVKEVRVAETLVVRQSTAPPKA